MEKAHSASLLLVLEIFNYSCVYFSICVFFLLRLSAVPPLSYVVAVVSDAVHWFVERQLEASGSGELGTARSGVRETDRRGWCRLGGTGQHGTSARNWRRKCPRGIHRMWPESVRRCFFLQPFLFECKAQIPLVASRHDMTRHLARAFWHRKKSWRAVWRLSDSTARRANRMTRVQWGRHSVDWGGHVHLTFSRSCSWDKCKSRAQNSELLHANTTASSSSAMFRQARLDTLVTMRATRRACCDVTQQVEFWLNHLERRLDRSRNIVQWHHGLICSEWTETSFSYT